MAAHVFDENVLPRPRWLFAVIAGWTLAGAVLAAHGYVSARLRGTPVDGLQSIGIWLAWAYAWALLTPAALRLQTFCRGARFELAVHGVAAIAFAAANLALFAFVGPLLGAQNAAPTWSGTFRNLLGSAFILNVPVYFLVVGLARWATLVAANRARQLRELALEQQLSEAKLSTLRAQLQPHFLFNSLNTIGVLMREDVDKADDVLRALAALLRSVLSASQEGMSPLADDLRLAQTYLEIEKARFGDRLRVRFDVAPDAAACACPSLLLQPLVENCVRHAVSARTSPTTIEVTARVEGDRLRLTIDDDGPGLGPPRAGGTGLANTRARLALLHPDDHAFDVSTRPTGGTSVRIDLPARRA